MEGYRVVHITRNIEGLVLRGTARAGLVKYLVRWDNGTEEWVSAAYLLQIS